jgi:hypothetical protein
MYGVLIRRAFPYMQSQTDLKLGVIDYDNPLYLSAYES